MLLVVVFCSWNTHSQTIYGEFEHDGEQREYILYIPSNFPEGGSLVFNLHGYTNTNEIQMFYSAMNETADDGGFAVCYPQGLDDDLGSPHWNAGLVDDDVDDSGFIVALSEYLVAEHNMDPTRVFSCGMSNGGFMSYHLACSYPDVFRAVASVTGSMTELSLNQCAGEAVPIFEIHGTADLVVPYEGMEDAFGGFGTILPIEFVVNEWVEFNDCMFLDTYQLEDIDWLDFSVVNVTKYTSCVNDHQVWFYQVDGGGHTWPGAVPSIVLGNTNQDFNASDEIWEFFNQFSSTSFIPEGIIVDYNVFPNPSIGDIQIDARKAGKLKMVDSLGKVMFEKTMSQPELIEISGLSSGMYFINFEDEVGFKNVKKVVVGH